MSKKILTFLLLNTFCCFLPGCVAADHPDNISPTISIQLTQEELALEYQNATATGSLIMEAIDQYYFSYGHYPEKLDDLIPEFLDEIPTTSTGQKYKYKVLQPEIDNKPYLLSFRSADGKWGCSYYFRFSTWDCSPTIRD